MSSGVAAPRGCQCPGPAGKRDGPGGSGVGVLLSSSPSAVNSSPIRKFSPLIPRSQRLSPSESDLGEQYLREVKSRASRMIAEAGDGSEGPGGLCHTRCLPAAARAGFSTQGKPLPEAGMAVPPSGLPGLCPSAPHSLSRSSPVPTREEDPCGIQAAVGLQPSGRCLLLRVDFIFYFFSQTRRHLYP